jgi:DNA-binding NtrC family response regulator
MNGQENPVVAWEPEQAVERELIAQVFDKGVPLPELKKMIQLQAITRALRMTEGNITKAAEMLGMRRPRLSQIINADDDLKALCQGTSK